MKSLNYDLNVPWDYVLIVTILILGILTASEIVQAVLWILVLVMCILEVMKLKLWLGSGQRTAFTGPTVKSQVSVHLATCNEPPEMVIETIKGVLRQKYKNFELIVVDNNTKDVNLWKPVQEFCKDQDNVSFFHLENWPFYKSGALNFARKVTSKVAEFVFVLDADYILVPEALQLAIRNMEGESTALVQFPQSYRCEDKRHVPILDEFKHFFDYYCFKADSCQGALPTGTLSLIRLTALDEVGGWPLNSITEDAELGSRLHVSGYDIRYVNLIIGKGIAPIQQEDFIIQRKRWIFGNVQTLMNSSMRPWNDFDKWLSGVSQLTAWANMLGLPVLILLCVVLLNPWLEEGMFTNLSCLSYSAYWIFTLSKMLQFYFVQAHRKKAAFQTFLIHFSSIDIGAFHWWPVLLGKERPFVRTDKSNSRSGYKVNLLYPFLHISIFFCGLSSGSYLISFSALYFTVLHIMAAEFDYRCRTSEETKISLILKLHS